MDRVGERATKKFYGTDVTPTDSPVQPERFRGYHTGLDFETFPTEADKDVPVSAACAGTVLYRDWVSGYGGVLVQSCSIDGQSVTVLYGHLRLDAIAVQKGDTLKLGQRIGVLGTGGSDETDGERKHLHFAVHRGADVELKGYVQQPEDLGAWIDPLELLLG